MRLLRVEFLNFRLLRDLELKFSSDTTRKLTVIRAANESGKTTILHGLQWALYGDLALPDKGVGFRLHPIDWDKSEGNRIPITVTVDFELTTYRRVRGELRETRHVFRLVRSTFEDIENQTRSGSTVKLFELKESGAVPVSAPESLIKEELPPELREVFFTDGDRALSFIEADVSLSTKRDRVQRAIRSLLGLGVIDDAISHVRKSAGEVNKKAKQISSSTELNKVATHIESIQKEQERMERELEDAKHQFRAFDDKLEDIDRKISTVLLKGDKEKLRKDLELTNRELQRLDGQLKEAKKEHSALFRSHSLAVDLLGSLTSVAFDRLGELHDQRIIPNTTVPILNDRLEVEVCICGESLEPGDPDSDKRRTHILKMIEDNKHIDEIQKTLTDLYFSAKPIQSASKNTWVQEYSKIVSKRDGVKSMRDEVGRRFRALEHQLDSLPDTDIKGLRGVRRQYMEQRDKHLGKQSAIETQLAESKREHNELELKRDRLLKEQQRGERILAEIEVVQDVMKVLQKTYERITNEELKKVSNLMNTIFLEMIGADPEQGAIIHNAAISKDFDIIVCGPSKKTLNPDRDLNGASRRALTLAFILALTKVSEVEAPNVIDTPLGMTSGFVKRSILRTAIRESSQLILLLTHDEISGCEKIIDEAAGAVFTLTNPTHFPKMLVNDPGVKETKILRCDCDHRSVCNICERHTEAQVAAEMDYPGGVN